MLWDINASGALKVGNPAIQGSLCQKETEAVLATVYRGCLVGSLTTEYCQASFFAVGIYL